MPVKRPRIISRLIRVPRLGNRISTTHNAWLRWKFRRLYESRTTFARTAFVSNKPNVNEVQRRLITQLLDSGIAHVSYNELFEGSETLDSISARVDQWLESKEVKEQELAFLEGGYLRATWKEYVIRYFDKTLPLSTSDPLLGFGLQHQILDVVSSYLQMLPKMIYCDIWNTIPIDSEHALTGSKRWHRDPEDVRLLKVFFYFTDVDSASGPLHYIRNSRKGEKYGHLWPQIIPKGSVPPENAVETVIPREDWEVCTYPAGTFVFADTSGLHMGGRGTRARRVLATWAFVSPASLWPRVFELNGSASSPPLSQAALFALSE